MAQLYLPVQDCILKHQDLIDKDDFDELYTRLNYQNFRFIGELTSAFYLAGIDPLKHVWYVPSHFFEHQYLPPEYKIPEGHTFIGSRAFYGVANLQTCYIPDEVEQIGMEAFADTECLHDLYIPYSVRSIGTRAIEKDVKIHCVENSVAHEYAIYNGNEYDFDYKY